MNIQDLQQKKWNIIDREWNGNYSHKKSIKILTKSIESSLCDYSDGCILVTGNFNIAGGAINIKLHLKIVHHSKNAE